MPTRATLMTTFTKNTMSIWKMYRIMAAKMMLSNQLSSRSKETNACRPIRSPRPFNGILSRSICYPITPKYSAIERKHIKKLLNSTWCLMTAKQPLKMMTRTTKAISKMERHVLNSLKAGTLKICSYVIKVLRDFKKLSRYSRKCLLATLNSSLRKFY